MYFRFVIKNEMSSVANILNKPTPAYIFAALQAFLVTMVLVPTLHFAGFINLVFLYDSFLQLMTATIVLCLLLSILLYFKARRPGTMLAEGGNTGGLCFRACLFLCFLFI